MKSLIRNLILVTALSCFCGTSVLLAQEASTGDKDAASAEAGHKKAKNLRDKLIEGGWVMFPIAICSILTVYLCGDGIVRTGRNRTAPLKHEDAIKNLFRQGDYVGAYNYCKDYPSPLTNVLRAGISLLGDGKEVVEEGMMTEIHKEGSHINTYISYLSVIGVCTPMIGLLGTVTGMIKAFENLGASGISDPSGLSAAIGEVLVATASGLFIAIPAFGMFYFLRNRSTAALHHIQDVVNHLFRKMPYDHLAGVHISDEELYAAVPNWIAAAEEEVAQ